MLPPATGRGGRRDCGGIDAERWPRYARHVTSDDLPIEYQLLKDILALDLQVVNTETQEIGENQSVRITMTEDPDILESCAFSLIFALGVLSFSDARPRGFSDMDYQEQDDWHVGDMLQHLRYTRGMLYFHADYVRGRCVKTTVEIDREGQIVLTTSNRGEAATRWVARLQGKKLLSVVGEEGEPSAAE